MYISERKKNSSGDRRVRLTFINYNLMVVPGSCAHGVCDEFSRHPLLDARHIEYETDDDSYDL
jgi:hypothetical protein